MNLRLTKLSLTDELTGIGNRRACMQVLEKQIQHALRYHQPLSMAMLDLDFFKDVNDNFGHPAGDKLLQHLTSFMRKSIRGTDSVFRFGGDEFIIIFPKTKVGESLKALKNLTNIITENPFELEDKKIKISLSIGLVEYIPEESLESFIHQTDNQLYRAKSAGRDGIKY